MGKHYILIDYENVQTKSLSGLPGAPNQAFRIMVFVGANQSKLPIELVSSMQSFGDKAQYVRIMRSTASGSAPESCPARVPVSRRRTRSGSATGRLRTTRRRSTGTRRPILRAILRESPILTAREAGAMVCP